ncbi:hypothetical protein E4T50_06238 [Aureobasidium sp. EXF-12298]|nr:hypothetical protein E4T50_06238 [Aureobasidium sp. EXF-12298]KAI4760752.1 hypothetical protein E4T51_06195 [Aureobasidium sp. EXF-12344]KAI4777874.1 hypothetical protein E4T52_07176 [Aureobasidium sp. EXF-3400]
MGFLLLFMSLIKYFPFPSNYFNSSLADSSIATLLMRTECSQQAPWQHKLAQGACSVRFCNSRPDQPSGATKYQRLGVAWACSLLGFLSLAMCVIPFAFIRFGDSIRERSNFCQSLKQLKQENEEREVQERRMQESGVEKATAVEKLV